MERETPDAATAARAFEALGQLLVPPRFGQTLRAAVHAAALAVAAATAPPPDVVLLGRGSVGRRHPPA